MPQGVVPFSYFTCELIAKRHIVLAVITPPGRGAEYCDQFVCLSVCLSANIAVEPLDRSSRNFLCRSAV